VGGGKTGTKKGRGDRSTTTRALPNGGGKVEINSLYILEERGKKEDSRFLKKGHRRLGEGEGLTFSGGRKRKAIAVHRKGTPSTKSTLRDKKVSKKKSFPPNEGEKEQRRPLEEKKRGALQGEEAALFLTTRKKRSIGGRRGGGEFRA